MSRFDYDFTSLWTLFRKLSRESLTGLLSPFHGFLEKIDARLPQDRNEALTTFCQTIWNARQSMPIELDEAITLVIHAVETTGHEDLAWYCNRYGLAIDEEITVEDLTVQAWLFDASILHHIRNEEQINYARTYNDYLGRDGEAKCYEINSDWVASAEQELADWFSKNHHGDIAKIFEYEDGDATWFLIYHGRPIKRISCIQDGEPSIIQIRPDEVDKVLFDYSNNRLQISARDPQNREQYRRLFGSYLFDDENFFQDGQAFSLDRIIHEMKEALRCDDVMGIERVQLTQISLQIGDQPDSKIVLVGKSHIEAMLPIIIKKWAENVRVLEAQFEIHFRGWDYSRKVKVIPPSRVKFKRDHRGRQIEQWLMRRGLCLCTSNSCCLSAC